MIPFHDFTRELKSIEPELLEAVKGTLRKGHYILGDQVQGFEQEFASWLKAKSCVGVANGMEALQIALLCLGIGPGDEVVTTAHTAAATALAIASTGAKPVFADIDQDSFNLDPDAVKKALTPKTKAILPVHLYGQCADTKPLQELAEKKGLRLVEDACQAHGALYGAKKAGTLGDFGCFSFYPTKNLGAYGDGGALVTNDARLAEKAAMLRNYGQKKRYEHLFKGLNSRLDELQAAMLRIKLKRLDEGNTQRRARAAFYDEHLKGVAKPRQMPYGRHVYHLYVIRSQERDRLQAHLEKNGVGTLIHYPTPLHRQPAFSEFSKVSLPVTEAVAKSVLSLPCYPGLTQEEQEAVCKAVNAYGKRAV